MLKIGVVGLGYWGPNLARAAAASPQTSLAHICDHEPDRLAALGSRFPAAVRSEDAKLMFDDPAVDAVAIATPVATHFELAKAALLAGKHVVVEKPFTASVGEADELIALADSMDRLLMVDHVFLYSPAVRAMAAAVHRGDLGPLHYVDSVRINLGVYQHDVNVIWDLAPHDLSIIDHLIGRAPRSLMAVGSSHADAEFVDVAYLHLDYGDGLTAAVHVNWLSPVKVRHFIVAGDRRSILYNDLDRSEPVKIYERGVDVTPATPEGKRSKMVSYRSGDVHSPRVDTAEPLQRMLAHFAECVETGRDPVSSAEQGRRVVEILEASDASLRRSGAPVELA